MRYESNKTPSPICTVASPLLHNLDIAPLKHHRGYIPHVEGTDLVQHVILHLSDSLPRSALERMRREVEQLPDAEAKIALAEKIEVWSDAGHGCCALQDPAHAELVMSTLLHFQEIRYRLYAWVIMPNHVHILLHPFKNWSVCSLVSSWKKFTASRILNTCPHLPHPLWQEEYWERYTRNIPHFRKTADYIHQNPVQAGLVACAEDWPWSSAKRWKKFVR